MYIFITLISAFLLGFYNFFKKVSLKKSSINEVLFFYCLSGFVLSSIFFKDAISLNFEDVLLVLIKSSIIVVSWYLTIKGMDKLDLGIVSAFSLINTILIVFGSALFFKEKLTWIHFASLSSICIGSYLIALVDRSQTKKEERKNHYWYLLILLFANVLSAASGLLDKYIINYRGCSTNGVLMWFLFFNTLIYAAIYLIKNKRIEWVKLKQNYFMIITGATIALSDMTYYYAISMDGAQLSLISILKKISVIVATILGSVFLKEKKLLAKLGILLIMIIGVTLPIIF